MFNMFNIKSQRISMMSGASRFLLLKNVFLILAGGATLFLFYSIHQVLTFEHKNLQRREEWETPILPEKKELVIEEKTNFKLTGVSSKKSELFESLTGSERGGSKAPLVDDVTVVTMYINIGSFEKGSGKYFTPKLYQNWMKVFSSITNPVLAFFDNAEDLVYFENVRRRSDRTLNNTKAIMVKRSQLWAFSLLPSISRIFQKPGYPEFSPNTVVPEYSCAMHAKYEVMEIAAKANFFNTRYFAWLDIGLFRAESTSDNLPPIHIWLPPAFNASTVAYTEVAARNVLLKPHPIVMSNLVWVCGCFFIGEGSVMEKWTRQYMKATEALINYDLMSTDQQVLYILFNWGHPKVQMQTYKSDGRYNGWFHLGYLCKEEGDNRRERLKS